MEKTVHIEDVIPSVIEPSFGIGRIMYAVLEHSFRQRPEDEKRMVSFTPIYVPSKINIFCAICKQFEPFFLFFQILFKRKKCISSGVLVFGPRTIHSTYKVFNTAN